MKIFSKYTLRLFDWFLILGALTFNVLYAILANEFDVIGMIASVTGVVCVVLVAKRSMSNYIFGLINVSLYAYISYESELYGDFLLNALYYIPMQIVGWFMWIKDRGDIDSQGHADESIVKSKLMSHNARIVLLIVCVTATALGGYLLTIYTGDPQPYKDSATTVLSVLAMWLMVRKYVEQWFLWVAVNVISILMWVFVWVDGGTHAGLMVIMYLFYLANSINGIIVWSTAALRNDSAKSLN
jgi:nicotinamide mononucleotide transporter